MKNNILLNPFAVINDRKLLLFGILTFLLGIYIAFSMQVSLQILRMDPLGEITFENVFINHSLIVIFLTSSFFALGKIINKKTRFIDILNTSFIALIPVYISLFQNINGFLSKEVNAILSAIENGKIYETTPPILFLIVSLLGLVFFIYYIYLLFIGFKTATNAKKAWHYVAFFATLIITDLIVSLLINLI